jgi:hypothetical protein
MVKKFLIILLSLIFLCVSLSLADTKATKKKEEPKKKEETKQTSTSAVQRIMPDPKNAPYKEKFGVGVDIAGKSGLVRIWLSNKLALEATAGLNLESGNPATLGLRLGGDVVFPIIDDPKFRLDLAPGLLLSYNKSNYSGLGDMSTLQFLFKAGLNFEVFLNAISNDLSIGSQLGLGIGIKNVSAGSTSTHFIIALAEEIGVIPIIIRYYL